MRASPLAAAFALLAPCALAAPPTVTVEVDPREGDLGDHVTVRADITTETGHQIREVILGELGERFALVGDPELAPPGPSGATGRTQTWRATLAVFASSEVTLPPLTVRWSSADEPSGEVTAALGTVAMRSVIPPGTNPIGPKDPQGPFELQVPSSPWRFITAAAGLAFTALALWLWKRRAPREAKPVRPARPPYEQALADLDALAGSGLVPQQQWRPFFYTLTGIVRVYFEAECAIGAPEMTSEELLAALREHRFPATLCEQMQRWITACDLVKYARQSPRPEHCETALTLARAIVTGAHHHHLAVRAGAEAPAAKAA